jgi:hypothetical protein
LCGDYRRRWTLIARDAIDYPGQSGKPFQRLSGALKSQRHNIIDDHTARWRSFYAAFDGGA